MELRDGRTYSGVERAIMMAFAVANPDMSLEEARLYIPHLNATTWRMVTEKYAPIIRENPHLLREHIIECYDLSALVRRARGQRIVR